MHIFVLQLLRIPTWIILNCILCTWEAGEVSCVPWWALDNYKQKWTKHYHKGQLWRTCTKTITWPQSKIDYLIILAFISFLELVLIISISLGVNLLFNIWKLDHLHNMDSMSYTSFSIIKCWKCNVWLCVFKSTAINMKCSFIHLRSCTSIVYIMNAS